MNTNKVTLTQRTKLLVEGRLDDDQLADTILDIGHSEFINRDDVLHALTNLIRHRDPDVRSEVVRAIAFHGVSFDWDREPGKTFLRNLESMAVSDEDPECRRAAASGLGSLMQGTRNVRVARLLSRLASDSSEKNDVRAFAYNSFLSLLDVPVNQQPNPFGFRIGTKELTFLTQALRGLPEDSK